jgi:hypothetical protein
MFLGLKFFRAFRFTAGSAFSDFCIIYTYIHYNKYITTDHVFVTWLVPGGYLPGIF